MANTHLIKRRISAANNISKITKAMEMVAASKMKRAQSQATAARPYSQALISSLQKVSKDIDPTLHELLIDHKQGIPLLVVVATEKGLCGNLNTQLLKDSIAWSEKNPNGKIVAIGKKAVHAAAIGGLNLHAQFIDLPERITSIEILPISSLVIEGFLNKKFSSVTLLYTDFINTLSQKSKSIQLMPIKKDLTGEKKPDQKPISVKLVREYTFEPSTSSLLNELLPYYIENTIYQAFLEARASEHSARMVTMKNASENANDLVSELKLEFNKSRQASITNELLDITTASMTIS
jgi:F-type H+-transporting ATPase subunit gamma